jgi:hypothetical protein
VWCPGHPAPSAASNTEMLKCYTEVSVTLCCGDCQCSIQIGWVMLMLQQIFSYVRLMKPARLLVLAND